MVPGSYGYADIAPSDLAPEIEPNPYENCPRKNGKCDNFPIKYVLYMVAVLVHVDLLAWLMPPPIFVL